MPNREPNAASIVSWANTVREVGRAADLDRLLAEHSTWLTVERGVAVNTLAAYERALSSCDGRRGRELRDRWCASALIAF